MTGQDALDRLRQDFPGWQISMRHIEAASGPGLTTYQARHEDARLVTFSIDELRNRLEDAEN